MQSRLISRPLLVLAAATLVAGGFGCFSIDRQAREAALTNSLQKLIPGGRIFPNDLAADRQIQLRAAYLYNPELVIEDAHGRVFALDRKSLAPKWYYSGLPGPMDFPPGMGPDALVMISGGMLFQVDRWFGNQLSGAIPLDFVPSAGPAATDSTVYVPALAAGEGYRTLITVNRATGLEGWGIATRGSISAQPTTAGTSARPIVYFVTESDKIFAYPAESSASGAPDPSWSHPTHGKNSSAVVVSGDLLLVASEGGELWALSRVTGVEYWVHYSGTAIHQSPWAAGDQVYFSNAEGFHALDRETGSPKWTFASAADFVVRRSDAVYVRTDDGTVHALDPESGDVLRARKFGRRVMFPANTTDQVFYMVTPAGMVFAVDTPLE